MTPAPKQARSHANHEYHGTAVDVGERFQGSPEIVTDFAEHASGRPNIVASLQLAVLRGCIPRFILLSTIFPAEVGGTLAHTLEN